MQTCSSCNIPYTNSEARFCAICGTPAPGFSAMQNPASAQGSAWPSADQAATTETVPVNTPALNRQPQVRSGFQADAAPVNLSESELLSELIKASNRTTHAIRALVRFIFIQLTFLTLAYILAGISDAFIDPEACAVYGDSCSPNSFFAFMSFASIIAGIIISSRVGWAELKESDVPSVNSGTVLGL